MKIPKSRRVCKNRLTCGCACRREIHDASVGELFMPWIAVPNDDVRVQSNRHAGTVEIRFRDATAVRKTVEMLENLIDLLTDNE